MLLHDTAHNRQPKAGPFAGRAGTVKGLEDLVPILRRNARAIILYPDFPAIFTLMRRHPEPALCRLAAITDHIQAGETNPQWLGPGGHGLIEAVGFQPTMAAPLVFGGAGQNVPQDIRQVQWSPGVWHVPETVQ